MGVLLAVVCSLLAAQVVTSSPPKSQCSPTSFKFSLHSYRNRMGHWASQVQLEHSSDDTSLPWNVDVDHTTAKCDENENVGIVATVTGDCQTGVFDISVSSFCTETAHPGPGYELIQGIGYYKMHTAAESWDDARKTCIREGTHLLILNSGAEMDAIKKIWSTQTITDSNWQNYIHVGAHDLYKKGEFVTILDQPLADTGYEVWDTNEPNNAGGDEDCLSVKNTGGLNDIVCPLQLGFICEREL